MYDVIIIGGGIAGLTAAIYAARRELKTLVLSVDIGGQMGKTRDIENWPGVEKADGLEVANITKKQAESFGAEFKYEQAIEFDHADKHLIIKTTKNEYRTRTVILAFGKIPRVLNIPGEDKFVGRGVSYCVNCDGPFFRNKEVAVVGGGNSALDAAIFMAGISKKVYLIHRRDEFRAEEVLINKVKSNKNIELCLNDSISKINGDSVVESVDLKSGRELKVSGVFIEAGYVVNNSLVEKITKCDEKGQIIVDEYQATSYSGVFAAGDMTSKPYQQMVIAAGEGATAALSAYDYIQKEF